MTTMNKAYEDGYTECLQTTVACLNEMGMVTDQRMIEMLKNKLLQHLLQKTTKNDADRRVSGIPAGVLQMPQMTRSSQVLMADIHSPLRTCRYGLSQEIQVKSSFVNTPGNLVISKLPNSSQTPFPVPHVSANPYISQLSPTVVTKQMSMLYADTRFSSSSGVSQSFSKSRFVPYKNKTRPALQPKIVCSSNSLQTVPKTTELVRNDTVAWSLNDDICYSIASFPSSSSIKSDQSLLNERPSKTQSAKKLQEKTRSESIAMPRKFDTETQRPWSTNGYANVELKELDLKKKVLSKSMADELTFVDAVSRHLTMESSFFQSSTSKSKILDGIISNPTAEHSVQSLSEELDKEDIWRPF